MTKARAAPAKTRMPKARRGRQPHALGLAGGSTVGGAAPQRGRPEARAGDLPARDPTTGRWPLASDRWFDHRKRRRAPHARNAPGWIRTSGHPIRSSAGRRLRRRIRPLEPDLVQGVQLSSVESGTNFGTEFRRPLTSVSAEPGRRSTPALLVPREQLPQILHQQDQVTRVGGGSFKAKPLVEARGVLGYRLDDHSPRTNALRCRGAPQQGVL